MADIRTEQMKLADARSVGLRKVAVGISNALGRLEVLALFPLIVLTASWFGFEDLAMLTAFSLSGLLAISVLLGRSRPILLNVAAASGRAGLVGLLDRISEVDGRDSACILVQIDDWPRTVDVWGHDTCEDIIARVEDRLQSALRNGDQLARLDDAKFGIVLGAIASARLGLRDTIANRLASALAEPIAIRGAILRLTASIGHTALIRCRLDSADTTFEAADAALSDALLHGPGAIRAYAPGIERPRSLQTTLSGEVEAAVRSGEIMAWFQPQICAHTRVLTGMESLPRWKHPKRGILGPNEFLAAVDASGQMPLLGQTLMHQALKALHDWDRAGALVPTIAINLSPQELRDPALPGIFQAELNRYRLSADRVMIDIAEAVALEAEDDSILAALGTLRDAGHQIDLDGFGLGSVSIPVLQRFDVSRIKIDQSFVLGIDAEKTKKESVAAMVAMAKALGIRCLAKGVETPLEMDTLTTLGCDFLQGFPIARPMSVERVADWTRARHVEGKTIRLQDRRNS